MAMKQAPLKDTSELFVVTDENAGVFGVCFFAPLTVAQAVLELQMLTAFYRPLFYARAVGVVLWHTVKHPDQFAAAQKPKSGGLPVGWKQTHIVWSSGRGRSHLAKTRWDTPTTGRHTRSEPRLFCTCPRLSPSNLQAVSSQKMLPS